MDNTNRLELKFARKYGGQAVKNSGRGESKGDCVIEGMLVDTKFTDAKSFSVSLDAFVKHEKDALRAGKIAAMVPVFMQHNERALAVVDFDWLYDLLIDYKNIVADLDDLSNRGYC